MKKKKTPGEDLMHQTLKKTISKRYNPIDRSTLLGYSLFATLSILSILFIFLSFIILITHPGSLFILFLGIILIILAKRVKK